MPWWETTLDSLVALAVVAGLLLVFLFVRRRLLSRAGGTFECSVRIRPPARPNAAQAARGWTLGLGRYTSEGLEWFRIFSFSPRPKYVFDRSMRIVDRRTPRGAEAFSLYAGHRVIGVVTDSQDRVELAMSDGALTGFLAWVEAAPPGSERLPS